jgi:hypothetical protein
MSLSAEMTLYAEMSHYAEMTLIPKPSLPLIIGTLNPQYP